MRFNNAGVVPAKMPWAGTLANNVDIYGGEVAANIEGGVL
jgi:hypothetical protein